MKNLTKIACHRGARLLAPENTFPAFDAALHHGGDVLEFDVRQSKDGVLYVIHDETVDRTTNGTGCVADLTAAELNALDAAAWSGSAWAGTRIPTLDAFLTRYAGRSEFYLEVKTADCQAIAHLIDKHDCAAQTYTCSFDPNMRADMLKYAPQVRQMLHCWDVEDPVEAVQSQRAAIIEFHVKHLDDKRIKAARAAGLELQFYSPDWNPDLMHRIMCEWRFDCVNIDHVPETDSLRQMVQF